MQLAIIPVFPLLVSAVLAFAGNRIPQKLAARLGVVGIASSFVAAVSVLIFLFSGPKDFQAYREIFWTWIPFYSSDLGTAPIQMAFYLDSLSAVMLMVVTFISSLIALFSASFMEEDPEIAWFFACINLFVAMMLILILADNFLVLFLGWEGVGLTSYLLIGFWRNQIENGQAAMKAFLVTRLGDVCLLFAIFLIFLNFGTLNIQEVLDLADANWTVGSLVATVTSLCLLGGAIGKSAQFPLQTWLADAMRGPTPVSALIHAATMVTAGVYLIARVGTLFVLSPIAQGTVLWIGAATLILAGILAFLQNNLKQVLAYSTMSQLGYMFLALGAGAYSAAIFHLTVHACFKALLFLGAGVIGHLMHHSYELEQVGNLRYKIPLIFWVFLIGLASLTALPFVTAGFYSKELILSQVFFSQQAGIIPWSIGTAGALLTGMYSARLFKLLFYGTTPNSTQINLAAFGISMRIPLFILAFLSLGVALFPISTFVDRTVLTPILNLDTHTWKLELIASTAGILGILFGISSKLWPRSFDFDTAYAHFFTKPYAAISLFVRADLIRPVYHFFAVGLGSCAQLLERLQSGNPIHYISAFILAVVVFLGFVVFA